MAVDRCTLSTAQSKRCLTLLSKSVPIAPRAPGFPTLSLAPLPLVSGLRHALLAAGIALTDVRLEGSAASSVLSGDSHEYSDLDLVFHLDGHSYQDLAAVRDVLLGHLADTFPSVLGAADAHMLGVAYLAKMFITPPSNRATDDAWALFTLAPGAPGAPALDLKFVQRISRPYQFSLNSFQIVLPLSGEQFVANYLSAIGAAAVAHADVEADNKQADTFIDNAVVAGTANAADADNASIAAASASSTIAEEPRPPTMEAVCMYGDFEAALQHVNDRVVAVSCEGDVSLIHGGGLLKYASLLCRGYTVSTQLDRARMEAMMISRFQIDYPAARYQPGGPPPPGTMDAMSQRICHFMATHMPGQYAEQANFLLVLHDVAASCTLPEVPLVQVSFNFVRSAQHVLQQMYLAGHVLPPPTPAAAAAYANFVRRASYAHSAPAPWASHGPQRHRNNNGPSAGRPQRQRGQIEHANRRPTKRGPEPAADPRQNPSGRAGATEANVPPPPPLSGAPMSSVTVGESRRGVPQIGLAAASTSQGGGKGRRTKNKHQGTQSDTGMAGHPSLVSMPLTAPIPGAALPTVSYASAAASASTSANASATVGLNAAAMSAFQLHSEENGLSSAQAGVAAVAPGHVARGVLIASPTDSAIGSDTSGDEGDGGHHAHRGGDGAIAVAAQPAVRRRSAPAAQVRRHHSSMRGGGLTEITNSVSATSPKNAVEKPVVLSPQRAAPPVSNARHPVQ